MLQDCVGRDNSIKIILSMETHNNKAGIDTLKHSVFTSFLKMVGKKVSCIFEPEEVEITFKEEEGKPAGSYTYTVIPHKQIV